MLHLLIAFSADLIVELSTKEDTQNVKWKEEGGWKRIKANHKISDWLLCDLVVEAVGFNNDNR
jgi:hypothetical protein